MLEVHGLNVTYGAVRALQNASVGVAKGGIVLLRGHHGAGKSSLLKAVIGAVQSRGVVRLDGLPVRNRTPHRMANKGVVLVPEGRNLFARLSTRENLQFGAAVTHARLGFGPGSESGLDEALSLFPELKPLLDLPAYALSGGQAQMLAFARGLMANPGYLLLDEPTLGLAADPAARVVGQIHQLKTRGIGVLMVEQNHGIAEEIADNILEIENGKITQPNRQ